MSKKKPKVHEQLDGLEISVDAFGEIKSSMKIEKINEFLNKSVVDKKLKDRKDLNVIRDENNEEK
ncbi:MAG: hypothetical protein JXQ90_22240 [Cyclobacteriaceae bacterium]